MFTVQYFAFGVALLLFAWYMAGLYLNRARSQQLLGVIREAIRQAGTRTTVKWFGRSAFQVDVGEPAHPFAAFRLLCLLEPRDFPLAQLWNRLRGRKDQVMIQVDFVRAPAEPGQPAPGSLGIQGLTGAVIRAERPHLQLTLQVGRGGEQAIAEAITLATRLGGRRS
ncbi:MAG TPA: hypothetical protein VGK74_19235 [Symbiobacteriaceae bacterium]|jgi:hypothetical protein